MEEVGIEAEIIAFHRHVEAIVHEGTDTDAFCHRFVCRPLDRGRAALERRVDAVDWIDPAAGLPSPTTPELGEVLMSAARIEGPDAVVKK
jgi:hypothetical protein